MPHSAESDLGVYCLHMSHKKDAELILAKSFSLKYSIIVVIGIQ